MQLPSRMGPDPSIPAPMTQQVFNTGAMGPAFDVTTYAPRGLTVDDGVADAWPAIMAAWADLQSARFGTLLFPVRTLGRYRITQNLALELAGPNPASILIWGFGARLEPAAGLTAPLILSNEGSIDEFSTGLTVYGLKVNGANTSGVQGGITVGNNVTPSTAIHLHNVVSTGFSGANAVAIRIKNVVDWSVNHCRFTRSTVNLKVNGGVVGLPTAGLIHHCYIYIAADRNIVLDGCLGIGLGGWSTVEAATNEGIYAVPTTGNDVVNLVIDQAWIEANNSGANYQIRVDGSNDAGAHTVIVSLDNIFFNGAANSISAKSCLAMIGNLLPKNSAGSIVIDTGVTGRFFKWPNAQRDFSSVVTNLSSGGMLYDNVGQSFATRLNTGYVQDGLAAGHFVINLMRGDYFQCDGTAAAYQIDNPTNTDNNSQPITIKVKNASGGALGAATFGANYTLGEAWVNPLTGNSRIISFRKDINTGKWQQCNGLSLLVAN